MQPSRLLDSRLADPLSALPPKVDAQQRSLALLNLYRGERLGLPAGDAVATAMAAQIPALAGQQPLTQIELGLSHPAPLWFYLLKEAELRAAGQHLGPVGGRLVAEVLVGLLAKDPAGFLRAQPTWKPTLPAQSPGTFAISDLLRTATAT